MNQVTSTTNFIHHILQTSMLRCVKKEKKKQNQKILFPFPLPTYHSHLQSLKNARIAFGFTFRFQLFL